MFRPRVMLAFVLTLLVLSSNADSGEDDKITTFRSGIEIFLQGLTGILPSTGSDSDSESEGDGDDDDDSDSSESGLANGFGKILDLFEENFHAIFPGTLWCGGGNVASDEDDLGVFNKTDACCRKHDLCPSNIGAGKSKGRLRNNGIFTRSACFCDHDFYQCLKEADTLLSTNIGSTYFNILRPQCFAKEYPIESCAEYGSNRIIQKKCEKYNFDESQNKTYQWLDNPDF